MASSPSPEHAPSTAADVGVLRPAWAEIDLDAVRDNLAALRHAAAPAGVLAVVKANAYGHGAVPVARAALEAGAWGLGVATVDEGVELRRAAVTAPVLVLGSLRPEETDRAVAHELRVTVSEAGVAEAANRSAAARGTTARLHLKVDTGMGRIGVPQHDARALARRLTALAHAVLEGVYTHFASADDIDVGASAAQLERFREALAALERDGIRPPLRHAANSAATLALPASHFDLVRCGIALYGIAPAPHLRGQATLRPAMRVRARVVHRKRVPAGTPIGYGGVYRAPRETTIATLPIGYADGYPRLAGEHGTVLLRQRRVPIAGRISMDQITVDAGDTPVELGDAVELWGDGIPVEDVADAAHTIAYEVLARTARRLPRIYLVGGRPYAVRTLLDDE
jgi:alanine racemase